MIIICSLCDKVEDLFDVTRLPSVEELRPSSCPLCGELAFSPGNPLGIVGHGTYQRQVLGVLEAAEEAITLVRRYFCRGCEHTINILSDYLHPRRWYYGGAILEALRLHLLEGLSEREIRERFGIAVDSEGAVYVTGDTELSDFPTQSPFQGSKAEESDVFITKLSSSGDSIVYSTYFRCLDYP